MPQFPAKLARKLEILQGLKRHIGKILARQRQGDECDICCDEGFWLELYGAGWEAYRDEYCFGPDGMGCPPCPGNAAR